MNPIISVWREPKKTTQYMLDHNKSTYSLILFAISGIGIVLNALQESGTMNDIPFLYVVLIFLAGAPIAGILSFYINVGLNTIVGRWLGGTANAKRMKKAVGVTVIPNLYLTAITAVFAIVYGPQFFETPGFQEISSLPTTAAVILGAFTLLISIWQLIVTSKALGIIHEFSSWRGLGVTLIGGILITAIIIPIVTAFVLMNM
ncbi:YIP1 family protein [Jeotgalibacillus terrae]|uniref:YIP1 family protein n=1 Tax=Jeotgalibacillus terrae TaxID=587735 RepID=A0ABW5ZF29_9BACL|nr:YIP1 family protein [Jeotgalibacillus terrae]MBM7579243.1 hypothetical protein [Jeotgalibacillus terrae]